MDVVVCIGVCVHTLSLKTSGSEQKWSMYKPQAKAGPS